MLFLPGQGGEETSPRRWAPGAPPKLPTAAGAFKRVCFPGSLHCGEALAACRPLAAVAPPTSARWEDITAAPPRPPLSAGSGRPPSWGAGARARSGGVGTLTPFRRRAPPRPLPLPSPPPPAEVSGAGMRPCCCCPETRR